jgi:hypothetical protein
MAYTQAYGATRKTIDNIKQRSQMPARTFDIHVGHVKNHFREQLAMSYEPGTDLYRDLSKWGINLTIIGGRVRDIPRRFQYFLEVIGAPLYRDAWARAWSNEKMGVLPQRVKPKPELPVLGDEVIDITNRPDTTPKEIIQIKQDFADYVKSHRLRNAKDYSDPIDLYVDMLWHNLHKIEMIFIAIKHLKAKIDENLKAPDSIPHIRKRPRKSSEKLLS